MKLIKFFAMLGSIVLLATNFGCEKADLQKSTPNDQVQIEPREVEDCDECPFGDCCCAVWLQNPATYADLYFCGTSDGNELCSGAATGNCDAFSGGGQTLNLSPSTPRKRFCVDPGQPFWVRNTSNSNTAYIYITCQYDETGPQTLTITLGPTQTLYISSNGECEIEEC